MPLRATSVILCSLKVEKNKGNILCLFFVFCYIYLCIVNSVWYRKVFSIAETSDRIPCIHLVPHMIVFTSILEMTPKYIHSYTGHFTRLHGCDFFLIQYCIMCYYFDKIATHLDPGT